MEIDTFAISPNSTKHNGLSIRRLAISENEGVIYGLVRDKAVSANEAEVVQLSMEGAILKRSGPLIAKSGDDLNPLRPPRLNDICRVDELDSTLAAGEGIFILDSNLKIRLSSCPVPDVHFVVAKVQPSEFADAMIVALANDLTLNYFSDISRTFTMQLLTHYSIYILRLLVWAIFRFNYSRFCCIR